MRQLAYDWHSERFLNDLKKDIESKGVVTLEWIISKSTMISTLNYIRSKGYKCQWIEKSESRFDIKITPQTP